MTRREAGARRKIAVVTTTRAEYGILRSLIREIAFDPQLELCLLVTGTHLDPAHGETVHEIEADGVEIRRRLPIQATGGDELAALITAGNAVHAAATALAEERPDLLVVVGDRSEILAFGLAGLLLRIPVAHLHGGETTSGAVDESIRHALTKLATFHFVAAEPYAANVRQLGEDPSRIFVVGAPALDGLRELAPLSSAEVFARIGLAPGRPTALVTYHPVTTEDAGAATAQIAALLAALECSGLRAVLTAANADAGGERINAQLRAVAAREPDRYRFHASLGSELYFGCLRHLDLMVGNSSSGLIEAPSFHLPVVNVGDRQAGRLTAACVITVACQEEAIAGAIARTLTPEFRALCRQAENPYAPPAEGPIGRRIKEILKSVVLAPDMLKKRFHRMAGDHA
jgi:UDP-hydrolysing UDP-N-acetyl-D-glucosamine 2-epimerase